MRRSTEEEEDQGLGRRRVFLYVKEKNGWYRHLYHIYQQDNTNTATLLQYIENHYILSLSFKHINKYVMHSLNDL